MMRGGTDKLIGSVRRSPSRFTASGGNGRGVPRQIRLRAQDLESRAGYEMRLQIEGVVEGGAAGEEALG